MSRLGMLPRTRSGGGAGRDAGTPVAARPGWMQRMDAARSIVAWVEADPRRASGIGEHPGLAMLGGLDRALAYLHRRWVTAFGVALDLEIEAGSPPGPATLARVCRRLAAEQPGLRLILEHHASHPAVREGRKHHRRLLTDVTGSPTRGG